MDGDDEDAYVEVEEDDTWAQGLDVNGDGEFTKEDMDIIMRNTWQKEQEQERAKVLRAADMQMIWAIFSLLLGIVLLYIFYVCMKIYKRNKNYSQEDMRRARLLRFAQGDGTQRSQPTKSVLAAEYEELVLNKNKSSNFTSEGAKECLNQSNQNNVRQRTLQQNSERTSVNVNVCVDADTIGSDVT